MNPTPTTAETPTPRTDFKSVIRRVPYGSVGSQDQEMVHANFARTLERELATAQAELTTLREKLNFLKSKGLTVGLLKDGHGERLAYTWEPDSEFDDTIHIRKVIDAEIARDEALKKLAEEQAGAASMRGALDGLVDWSAAASQYESEGRWRSAREAWHEFDKIKERISSTTGKATLEELERLRAEVVELKGELHTRFEKGVIAGAASVLEGVETKGIRDVLAERDTALATITELSARVKALEGAMKRAMSVSGFRNVQGSKFISDALQPTAPTEPEKATISEES